MTNRTSAEALPGVWAQNAQTNISNPAVGTSYRNTAVSQATVENGQPFANKVDFTVINQILNVSTLLLKQLEAQGVLSWYSGQTYQIGSMVLASDNFLYRCIQAGTNKDPTVQPTYWTKVVQNSDITSKANITFNNVTTDPCVADDIVKTTPDFITEYKVAADGNSWYRKYNSGWLEQGGMITTTSTDYVPQTITFPKQFTTTKYSISTTPIYTANIYAYYWVEQTGSRTISSVAFLATMSRTWYACGF